MQFRGIYTPAITPLNDDESIDWDGFDTVLEFLISAGVNGIIIGGTTGEYYAHSTEERETALQRAADVVAASAVRAGRLSPPIASPVLPTASSGW